MANQLWSDERITNELDSRLIDTYDLDGHRDGSAIDYDAADMLMTRMRDEYEALLPNNAVINAVKWVVKTNFVMGNEANDLKEWLDRLENT